MPDQKHLPQSDRYAAFPAEVKQAPLWVNYQIETVDGRPGCKVPCSPKNGQRASVTNPDDWGTFDEAVARDPEHIGRIVAAPYIAVDLDKCRNPETGEIDQWAKDLIASLPPTYAEVSPSGRGIHLWFKGQRPKDAPDGVRAPDLEVYFGKRYLTVTGMPL
jgi:putative DNA primase/helicase